jgi:hypothetical protein
MTIRLSRDEAKRLGLNVPTKASKYRNVPTVYNGVRYASKREAERAEALDFLVRVGQVDWWIAQPKFRLGCAENVYVPDFLVMMPILGVRRVHVEDVKGTRTAKFSRDVKLWKRFGPVDLWIIESRGVEIIHPELR